MLAEGGRRGSESRCVRVSELCLLGDLDIEGGGHIADPGQAGRAEGGRFVTLDLLLGTPKASASRRWVHSLAMRAFTSSVASSASYEASNVDTVPEQSCSYSSISLRRSSA